MIKTIQIIRKNIFKALLVVFLLFLPFNMAVADELTNNPDPIFSSTDQASIVRGPTGPVGPQEPTGPTGPTGPSVNSFVTQSNDTTGTNSTNLNSQQETATATADFVNNSSNNTNTDTTLNSGNNNITSNATVASVGTGDIQGAVSVINTAGSVFAPESSVTGQTIDGNNINSLNLSTLSGQTSIPLSNAIQVNQNNTVTGANSINTSTLDKNNVVAILDKNNSKLLNLIQISADTGNNLIDSNTQVGQIKTGDINLALSLINLQNFLDSKMILSLGIYSILNGLNGDLIIPDSNNNLTGPNSQNVNTLANSTATNVSTLNNSLTNNNIDFQATTGSNKIDSNSSIGPVETGSTNINSNVINLNETNTPVFYIINVFGQWAGEVLTKGSNFIINLLGNRNSNSILGSDSITNSMTNTLTGAQSSNQNLADNRSDTKINSINNSTTDNKINVRVNTGSNTISKNTKVGGLKTGSVNLYSEVINAMGNLGSAAGKLTIKVINIFGNWKGNLANNEQKNSVLSSLTVPQNNDVSATSIPYSNDSFDSIELAAISGDEPEYINGAKNNPKDSQNSTENNLVISSQMLPLAGPETVPSENMQIPEQNQQDNKDPFKRLVLPGLAIVASLSFELYSRRKNKKTL